MPGRLPTQQDFPSTIGLSITPPPKPRPQATNILILLHGLGDTAAAFKQFGMQLSLPETVCLTMEAPSPMPFDIGGFHWADDLNFNQVTLEMDPDGGFSRAMETVSKDVIEDGLIKNCCYSSKEIFVLGLGQGGMAALAVAASSPFDLGGIISFGGPLPQAVSSKSKATPVLVLGGSPQSAITKTSLANIKASFSFVEYHKWSRAGDGIPKSREEMMPVMRFFSQHLKSRQGVPEGSVEIT